MGAFALIGLVVALVGLAMHDGRIVVLGLILTGVGIAGDQNGF